MLNKHKNTFSPDIALFDYVVLVTIFWLLQNEFIIISLQVST